MGWIGVDLDGTLAEYDGWKGVDHVGRPVSLMLSRVKSWLEIGHPVYGEVEVRIMTARVSHPADYDEALAAVRAWCIEHLGVALEVTNEKDFGMLELWDDRAVQVEANTGRRMDGQPEPVAGPA